MDRVVFAVHRGLDCRVGTASDHPGAIQVRGAWRCVKGQTAAVCPHVDACCGDARSAAMSAATETVVAIKASKATLRCAALVVVTGVPRLFDQFRHAMSERRGPTKREALREARPVCTGEDASARERPQPEREGALRAGGPPLRDVREALTNDLCSCSGRGCSGATTPRCHRLRSWRRVGR